MEIELPLIRPGKIADEADTTVQTVNHEAYRQGLKIAVDSNGRKLYTESQAERIKAAIVARRNGTKA